MGRNPLIRSLGMVFTIIAFVFVLAMLVMLGNLFLILLFLVVVAVVARKRS